MGWLVHLELTTKPHQNKAQWIYIYFLWDILYILTDIVKLWICSSKWLLTKCRHCQVRENHRHTNHYICMLHLWNAIWLVLSDKILHISDNKFEYITVAINQTGILVPHLDVKSFQLIWRLGTCRFNLWMPNHHCLQRLDCLTKYQDGSHNNGRQMTCPIGSNVSIAP